MTKLLKTKIPFAKKLLAQLQKIGKSLLFPIAMLPLAAILLRIGSAIPQTTEFSKLIATSFLAVANGVFGGALPILFAIGIAFGMSKDQRGEAAITGFVVMVILSVLLSNSKGLFGGSDIVHQIYGKITLNGGKGFQKIFEGGTYNNILANNVFTGIFAGSIVAFLYNRFNGIELPSVLGFFSGRRLIPVLSFMGALLAGFLYAIIFPWLGVALYYIGKGMGEAQGTRLANASIMGGFGFVNRLLIPFGLHHVINVPLWFSEVGGSHAGESGDIPIFAKAAALGNKSGTFQAGFFPTFMFGLPAMAAAIWFNAKGEKQKTKVASLLFGASLVSFFTGITEPIEFTFIFAAPVLFLMHAVFTGFIGFIVGIFGIQLGFGFSAGLIDYVLSIPKSLKIIEANKTGFSAVMAHPGWIWVIGMATSGLYFSITHFLINKFNLNTLGRGNNLVGEENKANLPRSTRSNTNKYTSDAESIIKALGKKNIQSISNCATRLRIQLVDNTKIKKDLLSKISVVKGHLKVAGGYQIIIGPTVEMFADEIQRLLKKK